MDYKQVIVVRSDIKMSKGKAAAQSAHASLSAAEKADKKILAAWKKTGQKKIVLKVPGLGELLNIKKQCDDAALPTAVISDAGMTELPPGTITALGIGPEHAEKIDKITGRLKML